MYHTERLTIRLWQSKSHSFVEHKRLRVWVPPTCWDNSNDDVALTTQIKSKFFLRTWQVIATRRKKPSRNCMRKKPSNSFNSAVNVKTKRKSFNRSQFEWDLDPVFFCPWIPIFCAACVLVWIWFLSQIIISSSSCVPMYTDLVVIFRFCITAQGIVHKSCTHSYAAWK